MDLSSAISAAGATAQADFVTNLTAIVPIVLGISFAVLVWRRVRGQVR